MRRLKDNSDVPTAGLGTLPKTYASPKRTTKLHSTRPRKSGYSRLRQQKSRRNESLWWIPEQGCIWSASVTLTPLKTTRLTCTPFCPHSLSQCHIWSRMAQVLAHSKIHLNLSSSFVRLVDRLCVFWRSCFAIIGCYSRFVICENRTVLSSKTDLTRCIFVLSHNGRSNRQCVNSVTLHQNLNFHQFNVQLCEGAIPVERF